ncbi:MAG: ABC transporter ATP-binding protein [Ignavibacteria bacterium]|nr:ABC transporter ATP-binding protein [Ignavibacteria bacterium]
MIKTENLVKVYNGSKKALDGISFSVERGEICAYIGPNGAGKSTTMKILNGMIKPDGGSAWMNGINVSENPADVKRITGYVPESGALFLSLSPYEYLEFVCRMYEIPEKILKQRIFSFLETFGLKEEFSTPMHTFSKGMKQKVLIISSLIHDPEIILWDEPFSGIDYETSLFLRNLTKELASDGKTFLYSTHVIETISKLCTRFIFIDSGVIRADELITNENKTDELIRKFTEKTLYGSKEKT